MSDDPRLECRFAENCTAYRSPEKYEGRLLSADFTEICSYEGPEVTGCPIYDGNMEIRREAVAALLEGNRKMLVTLEDLMGYLDGRLAEYEGRTDVAAPTSLELTGDDTEE